MCRIDERYDGEAPAGLDENDPWRPLNVFIHGPGAIGQIVKGKWYNYYSDGQNPTSCCDSGEYDYFYDALGNVNGVLDDGGHYYRWEMDAFGNGLPGGNAFPPMDQSGAKEHLTGKMFDTATGLYYFAARWYDPQVGRFVSRDPARCDFNVYTLAESNPLESVDVTGLCTGPVHVERTNKAWKAAEHGSYCPGTRQVQITSANALTDLKLFAPNNLYHCFGFKETGLAAGLEVARQKVEAAIASCSDGAFGEALHFAQDCYAHWDLPSYDPLKHGKYDARCKKPDTAREILEITEGYIDSYACKCCRPLP